MTRLPLEADLPAYQLALHKWMPRATIRPAGGRLPRFDGVVVWGAGDRAVKYLVEEKRHLRFQDIAVVVDQLHRRR